MSNPIFLDIEQIVTILMGEMPRGVFAEDRADSPVIAKRSYSSSEIRAHASLYANLYLNLQNIYLNKFISTVQSDGLARWEVDLFSTPQNSALSFETRKTNLLVKWRARGGLSYPYVFNQIQTLLSPLGLDFALKVYSGSPEGAWRVGVSPLDLDTYLAEEDPLEGMASEIYPLDCDFAINFLGVTTSGNPTVTGLPNGLTDRILVNAGISGAGIPTGTTVLSVGANSITMSQNATVSATEVEIQVQNYIVGGISLSELQSIQRTAYTYAVYIYGDADATTLSALDQILTRIEPGGSTHEIFNNAAPPIDPDVLDLGGGIDCALVDAYDCGNALIGATFNVWDF